MMKFKVYLSNLELLAHFWVIIPPILSLNLMETKKVVEFTRFPSKLLIHLDLYWMRTWMWLLKNLLVRFLLVEVVLILQLVTKQIVAQFPLIQRVKLPRIQRTQLPWIQQTQRRHSIQQIPRTLQKNWTRQSLNAIKQLRILAAMIIRLLRQIHQAKAQL